MHATIAADQIRALPQAWLTSEVRLRLSELDVRPAAAHREVPPTARPWCESLALLSEHLPLTRRIVHSGDLVHAEGELCKALHIVNSGMVRVVKSAPDGRSQVVGLHFKGDWLGFDGIATGHYGCDAIAMDIGEVWTFRYDLLLGMCTTVPALMAAMLSAMSRRIIRDGDALLSLGTLPADARVAGFLKFWAESLRERDLRADQILLRMSRAEIGNTLGMTLETVSRALTRMARAGVVCFNEKGRRDIGIPSVEALADFIKAAVEPPLPCEARSSRC